MFKRGFILGSLAVGTGALFGVKVLKNMHVRDTGLAGGIHYTIRDFNLALFNVVADCADKFDDFMEDWADIIYDNYNDDFEFGCSCNLETEDDQGASCSCGCGCSADQAETEC